MENKTLFSAMLLSTVSLLLTGCGGGGGGLLKSRVVFANVESGTYQIYRIDLGGGSRIPITTDPSFNNNSPDVSRDGKKIVFRRSQSGNTVGDIYTMNFDGSNLKRLTTTTDGLGPITPCWSPDGSKIAFCNAAGSTYQVFLMNADGSGVTQLTTSPDDKFDVQWSPTANKLLYTTSLSEARIVLFDLTTNTETPLVQQAGSRNFEPSWSQNGERFAFTSDRDGNYEVYIYNLFNSGSGLPLIQRVTNNAARDTGASWSPDGNQLVFTSDRGGAKGDMYTIKTDGTSTKALSQKASAEQFSAQWTAEVFL